MTSYVTQFPDLAILQTGYGQCLMEHDKFLQTSAQSAE